MNNSKEEVVDKETARKRNSKSLNNGIDSNKHKDEQAVKTEDNNVNDDKQLTSHQRNKSTQRLGNTSKESIMQRLMEAKRKKKVFQQIFSL